VRVLPSCSCTMMQQDCRPVCDSRPAAAPAAVRPASWSKIRAVKHHLQQYDWVFWVDADTLITNSSKKLESLLPDKHHPDLILTKDPGGFNAGEPAYVTHTGDQS
jgi:hypothetical protein